MKEFSVTYTISGIQIVVMSESQTSDDRAYKCYRCDMHFTFYEAKEHSKLTFHSVYAIKDEESTIFNKLR